ncbi:hypothetical protein K0M31_011457, partial [Melipona bicolor]
KREETREENSRRQGIERPTGSRNRIRAFRSTTFRARFTCASPLTETDAAHMQNVRRVTVADTVGGLWASSGPCGNTPRSRPGTNCDFIIIAADLSLRPFFFFLLQHRREVLACLMASRPSVPPSNASRIAMSLRYRATSTNSLH